MNTTLKNNTDDSVITRSKRKMLEKQTNTSNDKSQSSAKHKHKKRKIKKLHSQDDPGSETSYSSDEEYMPSDEEVITDSLTDTSIDEEELDEMERMLLESTPDITDSSDHEEAIQVDITEIKNESEDGWETTEEVEIDEKGEPLEKKTSDSKQLTKKIKSKKDPFEDVLEKLSKQYGVPLEANTGKGGPTIEVYLPGDEEDMVEQYKKKKKKKLKKYFDTLPEETQKRFKEIEQQLKNKNKSDIPLYYRILGMDLSLDSKDTILKYVETMEMMDESSTDHAKIKSFVDTCIEIPFGKYITLPEPDNFSDFLVDSCNKLDSCTYGHKGPKMEILQYLCQLIKNPQCKGQPLGICGPPGIGKTTLIKDGLAKVLGRPFYFISLGGCSDSSYLDGHSFTYEGSKTGKIVDILRTANCMNPIFYFDELDKISETSKGDEISNLLVHLTDESQNSHFTDKYLHGIDIDLSKAFFVFSFNHLEKVNPILRDRINILNLEDFNGDEKVKIAKDYLIPTIKKEYSLTNDEYLLEEEQIKKIMSQYIDSKESGVRSLKKLLTKLYSKINMLKLGEGGDTVLDIMGLKKKHWEDFQSTTTSISDTLLTILLQNQSKENTREKLMLQALYT